MKSIQNFLEFIINNWTTIFIIICLVFVIVMRIKTFFSKSKEEKLAIAKEQISQAILKWVSDAEVDYIEWTKAGSIKRSQVIQQIYNDYPVISQVVDQDSIIQFIDNAIDEALKIVREIVEKNYIIVDEDV